MPRKTKPEVEQDVLAALNVGLSTGDVAIKVGVCERTVRAIKYRYGIKRDKVGRPPYKREMTSEAEALIYEYLDVAKTIALGECREHSNRPQFDRDEYISTAYLTLTVVATKWERRSSFKRYLRKCIKLALAEVRRREMLTQGWARNKGRGFSAGITHVAQITHPLSDSWGDYAK